MGEEIFRHADTDGDSLEVYPGETGSAYGTGLIFRATTEELGAENFVSAGLPRSEVLRLIQALTEWAYPAHTPEGPNRSLIEELIVKAVKDQVSAVLPLHLSPVACTHGGFCRDANGVQVIQCPEPDPEPGDVGHPRPPATEDGPCADCGHDKDRHRPACAKYTVGNGVCRCNAYKAPLPERKTCPHGLGWSIRCGKCETPRPVEPIAFKPPYCGLCTQLWNDGHGQPGDPCPGVEEARQHPGDWTDALWRVQPSAPASESRYCDECGHSRESHSDGNGQFSWCTAIRGKSACGCPGRSE